MLKLKLMKKSHGENKKQSPRKNLAIEVKADNSEKLKYYIALAVILFLSFLVYSPVLHNHLLAWDDNIYIKDNSLIYSINLKEIFSKNVMSNYHPITILTFAIEYHFFGLNETGYHAVNLLLHLLNVILVFYTVFYLSNKNWVALVAALLFGIHPMHVESVAWAAELKDLLYTFFFLASYLFYLRYLKEQHKKLYVFALLLFLVSLLSKAMAASLPAVLILTDYFKERKVNIRTLMEKVPFILLAIIFGIVAITAQKSSGAIQDITVLSFPKRIIFASYGFITYLWKLFFPLGLSAFYPYPIKIGEDIPPQFYVYLVLCIGLVVSVFYSIRFTKKIFFGLGFFAITIFLVLQLLPVGRAVMADRYSYIPSIGIFYLAGEGINILWGKKLKLPVVVLLSVFTLFFSVKTYARCRVWKSDMTLWNDVISQNENVPVAYYNRGIIFMDEKQNNKALSDFKRAIELDPNYVNAYNNRGIVLMNEKQNSKAVDDLSKAIELNPNLINAYINRGLIFLNENQNDKALDDFSKVILLDPNNSQAYNNRGNVFFNEKKFDNALDDFRKAITLNPNYFQAYFNCGNVFYVEKKYGQAISNYSKAIELEGNNANAYYYRGWAYYYSGDKNAACNDMRHAASLGNQNAAKVVSQICK